jgi:hypothetical protein
LLADRPHGSGRRRGEVQVKKRTTTIAAVRDGPILGNDAGQAKPYGKETTDDLGETCNRIPGGLLVIDLVHDHMEFTVPARGRCKLQE